MTTNKQIKRHDDDDDDDDDVHERGAEETRKESDTTLKKKEEKKKKKKKITGECSILIVQGRFHCCFEFFNKCLTEIECSQTK